MIDVISIEGAVVWAGPRHRSQRRVREIARWREKYPTVELVVAKLGFHPAYLRDMEASHVWSRLLLTRIDDTKPTTRIHYAISPLGRIEHVWEE